MRKAKLTKLREKNQKLKARGKAEAKRLREMLKQEG